MNKSKELQSRVSKILNSFNEELRKKIKGTNYLLLKYNGDFGIRVDDKGDDDSGPAILLFKDEKSAIDAAKNAKKNGIEMYMERDIDLDLDLGADKSDTQEDMRLSGVDKNIIKNVIGAEADE